MMTIMLRGFLVICALIMLFFVARKLRKSQIQVMDSIFWLLFSISLVLLALVPEIAFFLSDILGFQAPVNLVFLYVIGVLVIKDFSLTVKLSQFRQKLTTLIQEIALRESESNR